VRAALGPDLQADDEADAQAAEQQGGCGQDQGPTTP
jgi:hypothetical protein